MGEPVRHFFTKVVGVSHSNADGSRRQDIIGRCQAWERLTLDHQEDNPTDRNTVAVLRGNGEQIGYLNKELAAEVVERSGGGYRYAAFVKDLTGGGKRNRGVNLVLVVAEPGVTPAQVQHYADSTDLSQRAAPSARAPEMTTHYVLGGSDREEGLAGLSLGKTLLIVLGGAILLGLFVCR